MKIINIIGGLGNQMFQYAFAISLKNKFPDEEVLIDISHFKHLFIKKFKSANLHNGFEIKTVFPQADLPVASPKQLRRVTHYIPNYALSRLARKIMPPKTTEIIQQTRDYFAYNPSVYDQKGDCYYEGVWESVQYLVPVRELIQETFAHPLPNVNNFDFINKMENENSVGIHVRRGDYLKAGNFMGICDLDYYKIAISRLLNDGKTRSFYVFSNDIDWCKENIVPLVGTNPITMVNHNKGSQSCWDMFLMTHCHDLVIANSSFSWWGAFLNKRGGMVIAPKKWVNRDAEFDIWLPEWIRV